MLSQETLLGIRITGIGTHANNISCIVQCIIFVMCLIAVYSFLDLIKFIFTIPGVKSFLSERISQDPLEQFFGRQRQRGGVNENPTCQQFIHNNSALRMVNSIKIDTHKGNVGRQEPTCNKSLHVSSEPLPKRRRIEYQPQLQVQQESTPNSSGNTLLSMLYIITYTCTCITGYVKFHYNV